MATGFLGKRLVACLLNISEARRKDLVETVAKAALYNTEGKLNVRFQTLEIRNSSTKNLK